MFSWDETVNLLLSKFFSSIPKDNHVKIAKINKVLYQTGKIFSHVRSSKEWEEVSKRRIAQTNEIAAFDNIASEIGLSYAVVKTFRFPEYVPDDVDILIRSEDQHLLHVLLRKLLRRGYSLRSSGTTEMTISRAMNGTYVDFDIHTSLNAGAYNYVSTRVVFENLTNEYVGDVCIPTPNGCYELIISAAHAIMKEFEINLADILTVLYSHAKNYVEKAIEISINHGLDKSIQLFLRISHNLISSITLSNNIELPYNIPIHIILESYLNNLKNRTKKEGFKPISELLVFPKSKGIRKIINIFNV